MGLQGQREGVRVEKVETIKPKISIKTSNRVKKERDNNKKVEVEGRVK